VKRWPVTISKILSVLIALMLVDCSGSDSCNPGETRPCTMTLSDGGIVQRGNQACSSSGSWYACIGAGTCTTSMGTRLSTYARCNANDECGPTSCAVCGHYSGVENPKGYGLCYPFCVTNADCAPTSPAVGVTPSCILGQCTLLCRTSSTCPRDTECLRWSTAALARTNPGYDGLCE
jgi:hypothetical protein